MTSQKQERTSDQCPAPPYRSTFPLKSAEDPPPGPDQSPERLLPGGGLWVDSWSQGPGGF